jgi:hypothetical protein
MPHLLVSLLCTDVPVSASIDMVEIAELGILSMWSTKLGLAGSPYLPLTAYLVHQSDVK